MQIKETKLWKVLEKLWHDQHDHMSDIEKVCQYAIDRSRAIIITFPMFTLHDETHIVNVLCLMERLLGDRIDNLNGYEAALLILAACCHDIGMSCSESEKEALLKYNDRFKKYLDNYSAAYVKVNSNEEGKPIITDEILRGFLRSTHHERAKALLRSNLPEKLSGWISESLIWICSSHGEDCKDLETGCPDCAGMADLRMCAVLLRLADILDFDTSRSPQAIYEYCGFDCAEDPEALISKAEWEKHRASHGFKFENVQDRNSPYSLPYCATCTSMQVEKAISSYLDWVDLELESCRGLLKEHSGRWSDLVLPAKVARVITPTGYVRGEYCFTLEQNQILKLLGEMNCSEPTSFVRELLQNAIDAVRTREVLYGNDREWKPEIKVQSWEDGEGYIWFSVEDNGIGMTEADIRNYLLKVGSSYYTSDDFRMEKLRNNKSSYTPVSRFGIGILSCFIAGRANSLVEVSTKRYDNREYLPALRLRIEGLKGYYSLRSEREYHQPGDMPSKSKGGKTPYRTQPGTTIAVRTNLIRMGEYKGFREILDRYVIYPPVPIYYDGPEGSFMYKTESDFTNEVKQIFSGSNFIRFSLNDEQMKQMSAFWPMLDIPTSPEALIGCVTLDSNDSSSGLTGAVVAVNARCDNKPLVLTIDGQILEITVVPLAEIDKKSLKLHLRLNVESKGHNSKGLDVLKEKIDPFKKGVTNEDNKSDFEKARQIYLAFERGKTEMVFSVVELKKVDWYRELFLERFLNSSRYYGSKSILAHNGIICGPSFPNAIVLLQDNYRPDMTPARDGCFQLSLEICFECALRLRKLNKENKDFQFKLPKDFGNLDYSSLPAQAYLSLLDKHSEWANQLNQCINTEIFTEERGLMHQKDSDAYILHPSLFKDYLFGLFLIAYLQKKYVLRVVEKASSVVIFKRCQEDADDSWKVFPPGLFLPYEETEKCFLASGENVSYHICNALHPLSQFLIRNAKRLQGRCPGILNQLIFALTNRKDETEKLIGNVNTQLEMLRKLHDDSLRVTDDLFLKETDLICTGDPAKG